MKRFSFVAAASLIFAAALTLATMIGAQERAVTPEEKPREKPATITALAQPSPVVAALPYQTQTDYEQDPFDPTRVRRTTMQLRRVLLVRQDGTMEIKDVKEP